MKTKNKILIILASFILLLLLFNSKAFAVEDREEKMKNPAIKNIPTTLPYYDAIIDNLPAKLTSLFILQNGDTVKVFHSKLENTCFSFSKYNDGFKLSLIGVNDDGSYSLDSSTTFYLDYFGISFRK